MDKDISISDEFKDRTFITVAIEKNDWSGRTNVALIRINYELKEGEHIDDAFDRLVGEITSKWAQ